MPASPETYVTLPLFWVTLSLINAGLAQAKGRSGAAWWLASLFIGPLATLLIVAFPRVAHASEAESPGLTSAQILAWLVVLVLIGVLLTLALAVALAPRAAGIPGGTGLPLA
jgi:hypothetical protein